MDCCLPDGLHLRAAHRAWFLGAERARGALDLWCGVAAVDLRQACGGALSDLQRSCARPLMLSAFAPVWFFDSGSVTFGSSWWDCRSIDVPDILMNFPFFWPCFSCLVHLVKLTKFPGLAELFGLLCSLGSYITEAFSSFIQRKEN